MGWKTGLEPATLGTTNRCSNQLSYIHRKVSRVLQAGGQRVSTDFFGRLLKENFLQAT